MPHTNYDFSFMDCKLLFVIVDLRKIDILKKLSLLSLEWSQGSETKMNEINTKNDK